MKGNKCRTNQDRFLVTGTAGLIKGKDIAVFKKVRRYLKVATLSDILTADGKQIHQTIN